jgi:hypothetical protein
VPSYVEYLETRLAKMEFLLQKVVYLHRNLFRSDLPAALSRNRLLPDTRPALRSEELAACCE